MTAPTRKPAPRRKSTPKPDAAVAVEVLDEHQGTVTAGGLEWPAVFDEIAPIGYVWARKFAATPFVSTIETDPVVPGFECPTCHQRYLCADTICPELGDHQPALVQPIGATP